MLKKWLINASWKKRLLILLIIIGIGFLGRLAVIKSQSAKVTYETSPVEKGTLITSISGTGTITSGNYSNISTKVSGVVGTVYVTNGDKVIKGQKIAEVALDDYAKERQTAAWVSYLDATVAVKEAVNAKSLSDISMWQAREEVLSAQDAYDDMRENNTNPSTHTAYTDGEKMIVTKTLDQKRHAFSVSESRYLNSDADIANAYAKVTASLRNYQENSATIVALSDGTISDLSLAPGLLVNASSTTSSTSGATIVSAQTVGKINRTGGQLIASVSLTEVDVINVRANQKVTLTLDAYPDLSFTGKVLAVNTSGSVSSGVTSYPVTVLIDPVTVDIYPNMAISVQIITGIKTDVLLVPSSAIQSADGKSSVEVQKSGRISVVSVEIGSSNDSQTEIISGLSEGDVVVTSTITSSNTTQSQGTVSPFSGIGRSATGGSSGVRIQMGAPPGF